MGPLAVPGSPGTANVRFFYEVCMNPSHASSGPANLRDLPRQAVRFWHRHKWSYFFIAPSMILFTVFILAPMLQAFIMAFQKVDLRGSTWIGLGNFTDLL